MDTTTTTVEQSISEDIDELGTLKAQMADLQERMDTIRARLISEGVSHAHGSLFQVSISSYPRRTVDWKGVAMKLKAKPRLVEQFTKETIVSSLRVSARS